MEEKSMSERITTVVRLIITNYSYNVVVRNEVQPHRNF